MVEEIGRQTSPPAAASDCVRALKKLRVDRELAEVQRDLNGLQEQGAARDDTRTNALLVAKRVTCRTVANRSWKRKAIRRA